MFKEKNVPEQPSELISKIQSIWMNQGSFEDKISKFQDLIPEMIEDQPPVDVIKFIELAQKNDALGLSKFVEQVRQNLALEKPVEAASKQDVSGYEPETELPEEEFSNKVERKVLSKSELLKLQNSFHHKFAMILAGIVALAGSLIAKPAAAETSNFPGVGIHALDNISIPNFGFDVPEVQAFIEKLQNLFPPNLFAQLNHQQVQKQMQEAYERARKKNQDLARFETEKTSDVIINAAEKGWDSTKLLASLIFQYMIAAGLATLVTAGIGKMGGGPNEGDEQMIEAAVIAAIWGVLLMYFDFDSSILTGLGGYALHTGIRGAGLIGDNPNGNKFMRAAGWSLIALIMAMR